MDGSSPKLDTDCGLNGFPEALGFGGDVHGGAAFALAITSFVVALIQMGMFFAGARRWSASPSPTEVGKKKSGFKSQQFVSAEV